MMLALSWPVACPDAAQGCMAGNQPQYCTLCGPHMGASCGSLKAGSMCDTSAVSQQPLCRQRRSKRGKLGPHTDSPALNAPWSSVMTSCHPTPEQTTARAGSSPVSALLEVGSPAKSGQGGHYTGASAAHGAHSGRAR